jgi:hypothetical protein
MRFQVGTSDGAPQIERLMVNPDHLAAGVVNGFFY